MSSLAEQLASLSPEERRLLEQTLRGKGIEISKYQILPREAPRPHYPVSFSQRRLWFVHLISPDSVAYNLTSPLRLRGRLDAAALERALTRLVERHEALRTTFQAIDGEPVQIVHPPARQPLPLIDLSGLGASRRERESVRVAVRNFRELFDLGTGPLVRTWLARLDEESHAFLLSVHHIVFDGWSLGLFLRELLAFYDAERKGELAALEKLPIQYADFALWQRCRFEGESRRQLESYWTERLADLPDDLELPFDRPRPAFVRHRVGLSLPFPLNRALSEEVRAFSRRHQVTVFVTALAAYQALLARFSGQSDIVVGAPVAGRNRVELEGLIGFFINTLLLRGDLRGDPSFAALLRQANDVNAGANSHQDMPFELLVDLLQPDRRLNRMPLYQVGFSFQPKPGAGLEVEGLELGVQESEGPKTQLDLLLVMTESPQGLVGLFSFDDGLFDPATILRLGRSFVTLLRSATADPERRLTELDLESPVQRHQVLVEWSPAPGAELSPESLLHRLFEAQAERSPDAPAVVCGADRLTYRQLDERANQLACVLRRHGAGPEVFVGLCLERSVELIVGLVGILKSGAAYLPCDPAVPVERLAFMLDDAQAAGGPRLAVVRGDFLAAVAERVRRLDLDDPEIARQPTTAAPGEVDGRNAAYVIYTSGSTGTPKGVVVTHRQIADRVWFHADLEPSDAFLQRTSVSFDVSLAEIFAPLACGARTVLPRPGAERDLDQLDALIRQERLTHVSFPPSTLELLLKRRAPAAWTHVKHVSTGGETVPVELPDRFFEQCRAILLNRYGPTEATVSMLAWSCRPGDRPWRLPLGHPLAQSSIFVLDRHLLPAPIQAGGEMVIGGGCVARGYLHRPRKSAEVFVPDPLTCGRGVRLYRTGDWGRWRADGAVEFLGRIDRQVKVRGFRVELGEIEAVLRRHPAVADAAVVDRKEGATVRLDAYVAAADVETPPGAAELRAEVGEKLPPYMVPATWTVIDEVPYTASRKVNRRALPAPVRRRAEGGSVAPRNELEAAVAEVWQEVLEIDQVGVEDNFFDLGGHSLLLVQIQTRLREHLERDVPMIELFRFPTVGDLAGYLRDSARGHAPAETTRAAELGRHRAERRRDSAGHASAGVAVIGMACRFPGANTVEQYWHNLVDGVESIREFTAEELIGAGLPRWLVEHPNYVKRYAVIDGAEDFDAPLFGLTPREAEVLDPQHRLFMECAWEALERAGCSGDADERTVGVFGGVGASHHWLHLMMNPALRQAVGELAVALGNEKDFLPTRTSYHLDLKGPSVNVQTACSTSLVAVHLACQSLLLGECEMALAGGVSAVGDFKGGYMAEEGGVSAPDGHTYTFDARAAGTTAGHGAGLVLLKRLDAALADGDPIHAVIKGSAINNDGSFKVGFTAPSITGQARCIAEAQAVAGAAPESIGFVETHGTATPLGDPIEVAALKEVFGSEPGERCALGAVKTNFGHLNTAAGAAGLIKAVLALEHRRIPPTLHFETPNPEIDLAASPFYVNTEVRDWVDDGEPRRAGVSSFGLGGTNAHVVLEEAPAPRPSGESRGWQLLVQSAKTESALEAATDRLAERLASTPEGAAFADTAHTLQVGRRRLGVRQALVGRDPGDAADALAGRDPRRLLRGVEDKKSRGVTFLLPGVGDHYVDMGRELYDGEPTFRHEIDRCAEILRPHLETDLRELLFSDDDTAGDTGDGPSHGPDLRRLLGRDGTAGTAPSPLDRTRFAQPAVFVIEYSLARLWNEWGISPEALIGYSLGEYTAACLAGVFSLEDALALVADRARWIDELPAGGMLAVLRPAEEALPHLGEELSLAAYNAPEVSVVAGPESALAALEAKLAETGQASRRLKSSHAFHSRMMKPVAERLAERVRRIDLSPPAIPYLSNVTGTWITDDDALDPAYWARHLCRPVRFAQGIETLFGDSGRLLLEVGPGQALATSARQHPARGESHAVVSSMRDGRDRRSDVAALLEALGRLWIDGAAVDWTGFARHEERRRVELPVYPFERRRYWVERPAAAPAAAPADRRKKPDVADWFWVPTWQPRAPLAPPAPAGEGEPAWLVFADGGDLGERVGRLLAESGREVAVARPGAGFESLGNGAYAIDPSSPGDYARLLSALEDAGRLPSRIAHFWNVASPDSEDFDERFEAAQNRGLYSLLRLCQALIEKVPPEGAAITMVSSSLQRVTGHEDLRPEKATVLGAMRVIPQEYRDLACRSIDVDLPAAGSRAEGDLAAQVAAELTCDPSDRVVAYRSGGRLAQGYQAIPMPSEVAGSSPLRRRGVYLITGGLGNVGLILADALARRFEARLVLAGRSPFPQRGDWPAWLEEHDEDDATSTRIRLFQELEEAGAEILPETADAADRTAMAGVLERTLERFGELHGVIHLAGSIREGLRVPVEETKPEDCRRHAAPKVQGLRVLEELLAGRELDFCYLFSSLATVLGGLGFGAYTAANAYLDAFAERQSLRSTFPWISADWDGWPPFSEDPEQKAAQPTTIGAMSQVEAADAFERVLLLRGSPRVVVSTTDLEAQIAAWIENETPEAEASEVASQVERPVLKTPYAAPSSDNEAALVEIWQQLLGFAEIGIHDNYFELGGDSLLATRMLAAVRRGLRVQLTLRHLFDHPTVAGLASVLETSEEDRELSRLEDLLSQVENLSAEDVARHGKGGVETA